VARELKELQQLRAHRRLIGLKRTATLEAFAAEHLVDKAKHEDITDGWLEVTEVRLRAAVEFFGANRELSSIRPSDVKRWMDWIREHRKGKGHGPISGGTVRHYLNALSNLYRTAQEEEAVPPGYNPVAAIKSKPKSRAREARWFEVHEAALILEGTRMHRPTRPDLALPFLHPMIACYLLTGGRKSEVLGLEVEDISFDRKTVTFRSNEWRRLKTEKSHRVVPLWPQLKEILGRYLTVRPPTRLLFPAVLHGREQLVWSIDKPLDEIAERIGLGPGAIRAQMFRNTYCAARLQTVDNGQPISVYTVSRELGHTSTDMVQRIYAHLGQVRHRSEVMEYRVEQHEKALGDRLTALRVGSRAATP
jgi:integrase